MRGKSFEVLVNSHEMEPHIYPMTIVEVDPEEPLVNGRLCYLSKGDTGNVRRYFCEDGKVVLKADNPEFQDIEPDEGSEIFRVVKSKRFE